ncbi:MAG: protein DpdE [Chloroflexi bacterium]|nr:protein DpdE [Chloroflexota bacterium]
MTIESLDAPACPVCGARMTIKEAQRGRWAGSSFWGCPRFPACRGALDLAHGFDQPAQANTPVHAPQLETDDLRLRVGGFVWTYDRALLGKLIELAPGRARVRIVHSVVHQEEREYDPAQLERAILSPQTRVYLRDEEREAWSAGRVIDYDRSAGDHNLAYVVRSPGRDDIPVLESELEARCFAPTVDPTDALAGGGIESQYFSDRRLAALRASMTQQSAAATASGLVSASVRLLPHQFHVVRRLREDPVQRYLLADEVGLGKTIEAGAVLRQLLNDAPTSRVAIVAPTTLLRQWERELYEKFDIDTDEGQVTFYGLSDLGEILDDTPELDLLIIDEAHHLIGRGGTVHGGYELLARAAHKAERLLLLTATPVLGEDAATLALLNLLDPLTYPLDDVEGFRSRSERRQRYGELVLALDPGASPALLGSTISQIAELIPDDPEVQACCARVLDTARDIEERRAAVHDLRDLISDTYRLDHRLIRTRRVDADWPDRFCQIKAIEIDDDSRVEDAVVLLEQWRGEAAASPAPDSEGELASQYEELLEALGRGIDEYATLLRQREANLRAGGMEAYPGENAWLEASLAACDRRGEGLTRLELCVESIRLSLAASAGEEPPRIVAFTSSTAFAQELAGRLERLPATTVTAVTSNLDDAEVEEAVGQFERSNRPAVLVADRTAEEGLNLQAADGLLLTDLPFAPERLEQRIGRLDRMGRRRPDLPMRVVLPDDRDSSPWLAWHELLRDGFRIYSRSISDVHFLLDDLRDRVRLALFRRGAAGVADLTGDIRAALDVERRRQDRQFALNQLNLEARDARDAFASLEAAERRESQFEDDISGWLFDVLSFRRDESGSGVFRVRWNQGTQVPEQPGWRERFESALERPLTFDRDRALADARVRLVRPGFALYDEMLRLMRRDDRGTAFATWRPDRRWPAEAGEWLGFRVTYVAEIDEELLRELLESDPSIPVASVRSLASDLFPPWIETRDYDANVEPVRDPLLVDILQRDYDRNSDLSLAGRPEILEAAVGNVRFAALCREVRIRSEESLRSEQAFSARLEEARSNALQLVVAQQSRLGRRRQALASLDETDSSLARRQLVTDALRQVVGAPCLRLEAIGAFIVSRRRPEVTT